MWFGDEEEAARLEASGHLQLEAGDFAAARETASSLIAMAWSGGFVLDALVLRSQGQLDAAVAVLDGAVERAPAAWRLWQLLGNLRSDLELFDEAIGAFDRALECEGSSMVAVRFNRAIANRRAERFGDALADLDPILSLPKPPVEIAEAALALTLECLASIGRAGDARNMIEAALERCDEDDPRRGILDAEHALALDRAQAERAEVEAAFVRAVDAGIATAPLLALGRKLSPTTCTDPCQRLQLVAQGDAPPGSKAAGFLRVFDVVAPDAASALELARRHVMPNARASLRIERCDVREGSTELEPGVYAASELMLYT